MTDKEILQKVFNIAYNNEWNYNCNVVWQSEFFIPITEDKQYYKIIFSHEFAKAFWGEKLVISECDYPGFVFKYTWQSRLAQMVLEKEPLRYLEKFL